MSSNFFSVLVLFSICFLGVTFAQVNTISQLSLKSGNGKYGKFLKHVKNEKSLSRKQKPQEPDCRMRLPNCNLN